MPARIFAFLLTLSLLSATSLTVFAQDNSWKSVEGLGSQTVAVQKTGGDIVFGQIVSATDSEIVIRIADKAALSTATTTIARGEIKKVWLAKLNFGKRNTGKGALIGAGVGAGIGVAIFAGLPRNESTDGLEVLAVPLALGIGTGVGLVAGFFSRKGHQKGKLVYRV